MNAEGGAFVAAPVDALAERASTNGAAKSTSVAVASSWAASESTSAADATTSAPVGGSHTADAMATAAVASASAAGASTNAMAGGSHTGDAGMDARVANPGPPLWLLCELTYTCPLHCVFCYNPTDFAKTEEQAELSTDEWIRVLRQGRELGAVQLGLSGGEPLTRGDLETIVGEAHTLGYYTNLITSGIGLTEPRLEALKNAGLDHIQLSFQDSTREVNDFLSSTRTFELKSRVAALIKKYEYPMVLNVVLHRLNIDHVQEILEMAQSMGAEYVELANTQYYGWAWHNRERLLPSREQLRRAEETTNRFRERVGSKMRVLFVVPDYFERRPKPCMNGLGSVFLTVTPDGTALPCHAAKSLPGLTFPNVKGASVEWIWRDSPAFNHYRGDSWMKEPCRSCPEKAKDFGGCRCQAYLLTGDPDNADPVCDLSPYHHVVTEMVERASAPATAGLGAASFDSGHINGGALNDGSTNRGGINRAASIVEHPLIFRDRKNSRALSG